MDDRVGYPSPHGGSRATLRATDVHVTYRVYQEQRPRLRELFAKRQRRPRYTEVHAVRGVSVSLEEGEVLGVIGANGSGKSTLIRALAGLQPVTGGQVRARSQPVLLGVGAALQPKLSGRRNVYLGCLALGMRRSEIDQQVEGIVEFSGVGDAIDRPLRTYSSGMRARLHFAIATAITPEILLIDEALAVGDDEFKARSRERIEDLRRSAAAVVLVTHSLDEVMESCTRAMWLDEGVQRDHGTPLDVVTAYGERRRKRGRTADRTG